MTMNPLLASIYGTLDKTASVEDHEKVAQAELFAKLAAKEGIDLAQLNDDQIKTLWTETFTPSKTAAAEEKKDEKEKKKDDEEKKAQAEFAEKHAAAEKIAEADKLGRIMAHSLVDELDKIGAAKLAASLSPEEAKTATVKNRLLKIAGEMPPWLNKGKGGDDKDGKEDKGGKAPPFGKKDDKKDKDDEKDASAFEIKAAEYAVNLVKAAGQDPKVAAEKVAAVFTLGAKESTKVASAPDYNTGLHVRALELLEQAGYEVNGGE